MKNINNFTGDSNVIELNSTELNEIVGGSWLSKAWQFICDAYYDLVVATDDRYDNGIIYLML